MIFTLPARAGSRAARLRRRSSSSGTFHQLATKPDLAPPGDSAMSAGGKGTGRGGASSGDTTILVVSRAEIERIVVALEKSAAPVSVMLPGAEDELAVSVILGHTLEEVFLSYTADKRLNSQLFARRRVRLVAGMKGSRVEFIGAEVRDTSAAGRPAFGIRFPDAVLKGTRRAERRYHVPPHGPFTCSLALPDGSHVAARVADISQSGIGLIEYEGAKLEPGLELAGCRISLPGAEPFDVTLRVRHCVDVSLADGTRRRQLGCEFVAPSPTLVALIGRFVVRLPRAG